MKMRKSSRTLVLFVLVTLVLISLLPMFMVLINSFKNHIDIVKNPLSVKFTAGVNNYVKAWNSGNFGRAIMNSIIYTGTTVLVTLADSAPCAYVIAFR